MLRRRTLVLDLLFGLLLGAGTLHAATIASVFSGRIPCIVEQGVQFCSGDVTNRIESFDGIPLDTNVTLPPASMDGPFPLIVDLHGWSLGKTGSPYVAWAQAGYVVLSYTARGFHNSCGNAASRLPDATLSNPNVCVERGWIHLADVRYEAHDTQHLAGLLADEGLVTPTKVGVTGASYGGGQTMILAALRNRVMQPDGTLVPWKSPAGLDMTIAAGAALIPWSDLAYSLTPNGRTLDYRDANPYGRRGGVQKQSWNAALYTFGLTSGTYAAPGVDFGSDIQTWNARVSQGEPYDGDPTLEAILNEITSHHSAYYVDDSIPPAPLFVYNAWTDDLFPVDESLRYARKTLAKYPDAEIALLYADDFGHSRAALGFTGAAVLEKATAFFARHLKGTGDAFPPLQTFTQACNGAAVEGPITATNWAELHLSEVRYKNKRAQRFTNAPGLAANATATDPFQPALGPCRTVPAADEPNAATYRLRAATGDGYTLLGSPTVIAVLGTTGPNAQVVAHLWDVGLDGNQTLVAQTVYRPRTDNRGVQVFQLHPNAWRFAAGHVAKLELLGQSAGYMRPSNGAFTVTVSGLELRLPTHEAPGRALKKPAPAVQPSSDPEPIGCALSPLTTCHASGSSSSIKLKIGSGPSGGRLKLDWRGLDGFTTAAVGNPTTGASMRVCLYDGATLVGSAIAPGGGTCGKKPCWKATADGFTYGDAKKATGMQTVRLSTSGSGAAKVAGRGPALGMPTQLGGTLTTQLVSDGDCWSSTLNLGGIRR